MPDEFDPTRLARFLKVLANPARLEILRRLNRPRTLQEIHVAPHRAEHGQVPTRPMSQVAVRKHLLQLLGIGVVQGVRLPRPGRSPTHYQLSRPQMFALSEEFLAMVRLEGAEALLEGTLLGPPTNLQGHPPGPHLVLVRGVEEGRFFPLEARPERVWRIGRRAGNEVCLDYDGYLSQLNSRIRCVDGAFAVEDVPGNRNGTRVNWAPLPRGGEQALSAGDVVGVGRSLLLFRDP
ncbi:MAG: Inner rane component of cytoplasmic domain [Thermoplasmata archaeon]|jgi:DNA-binding transcriptional ArsR family regulator|nr:Inner rane component of cytoplasmic domain [Thermoplasmata archaeon]